MTIVKSYKEEIINFVKLSEQDFAIETSRWGETGGESFGDFLKNEIKHGNRKIKWLDFFKNQED